MTSHSARLQQKKSHSNRLRRQRLRTVLFETLEQRALMASDSLSGFRWSVPTGGTSPNEGDPATITWSIVPDGTTYDLSVPGTGTSNFVAFMDGIYGTAPGAISARPWFNIVSDAYDRWAQVSGLTFVYEPADDGLPIASANRGVTRVRGDIRLSGRNIDGNGNQLATGLVPSGSGTNGLDGDTIIDTSDLFFANNAGGDNRGFINALAQQTGIALGLGVSTPANNTKLMEAAVSLAFIGPQHDDILSIQTLYGDNNEQVGDPALSIGLIANGRQSISQVSIDRNNDSDVYSFSTISSGRLTVRVTPVGQQYLVSSPATTPVPINTTLHKDLAIEVRDSSGTLLARASAQGVGQIEELLRLNIPGGGNYQIRVLGSSGETQFYTLDLIASGFINNGVGVEPPRLLSVSPNSGQIFDPNVGNVATANVLTESPRELVFRFSGSQQIDAASLRGIRITRSGGDNVFGNSNDVVMTPAFLGFGDSDRIVVARFGAPLPDDRYKIEVLAVDDAGLPPLQSIDEQVLLPRFAGTDRDTFYMNLELGAKITAVVPQPVVRQADGSLIQERDKIDVYFTDDDLDPTLATRPEFYKLILTRDSVTPNDDIVFSPTSVTYDAAADKAVLVFAGNIDELAGGSGTFRLRIGSNRSVASFAAPQTPTESILATDVGDTLASASTVLGTFNSQVSRLVNSTVAITATNRLNLVYPGSNFEPGHRDIQDETHVEGIDVSPNITKILYNFAEDRAYGFGSNGQPLFTTINSDQKQRVREIFEFYSAQAGIDIVETQSEGLTIVVGDLFPLNNPPAPFTPAGIAGGGLAIMNGALSWNNGLGESFFDVSLHEIGHLLGLGHTYEQPSGTVMGSTGELDSGNPIEFFFPGDYDITHLQHIHRPDNRDVDIYKFDVPVGQKGNLVIETIAERLNDSSDLDTHLTLFKRDATGLHIIAVNDNYFSDDSLIRIDLVGEAGAEYFIAVTSRGNESFDPKIDGSGSGGISEGRYQLRVDYRPSEVNQILDTSGTPLDGDGDGTAGGDFNFWFRAASPVGVAATGAPRTIFVDKDNLRTGADGSLQNPYQDIPSAIAMSRPGDIVRIAATVGLDRNVGTVTDNPAYEIGDGGPGKGILADGPELTIPKGVTLMIDAGAILKLASAEILVGSTIGSTDRSGAAIQILGTPLQNVLITSHFDESIGKDTNLLDTVPRPGQWGGIEIRNDADREQGRREPELDGIFLNYIGQADIRFGGGQVGQGSQSRIVNPIHLTSARPTLLNNKISQSGDAGISADPNSFEETLFTEARYQFAALFTPDYSRVGPDIRGQQITSSSANALAIRFDAAPGIPAKTLSVAARLDDTEIAYVIGQNLIIDGTPGGSIKETIGPNFTLTVASPTAGGTLVSGQLYEYRMTFVDRFGNEGLPSTQTLTATPSGTNLSTRFDNLPTATGDFVGRRLYRRAGTTGTWDLISELDRNSPSFTDRGSLLTSGIVLTTAASLQRARPDASLVVDPGVVIKLLGSRIEVGIGANLIAEGSMSKPVVFTSLNDDRFGAGATFDTNNDLSGRAGAAGDWSGIVGRHLSSLNIDSARLTFGGGSSAIAGGFAAFSTVEIHQGYGRVANSILEDNASANQPRSNRDFRGPNDASTIYVVASQPAILNNVIRNNGGAAISIDANSMKATPFRDPGRVTGLNQRSQENTGNLGPFVVGNALGGNTLNGMRIRGATLTTESVWDDTDIVHILQSQIVIPDFHTYGGLRLQSKVDESLVVKLSGNNAGITASGRPLDIPTRIGGSLQIIGAPGFPVVLTSIADDSAGAGFDSEGRAMLDTNNNGPSTGVVGGWRSVRLNPYSNDRNLDTLIELESDPVGDANRNDLPANAQSIGAIANNLNGGDENVRLGFTVHGTIAANSDLDTYRFTGTAGTTVWFDLDRTGSALDSVVELIDTNGRIIAQSNNSYVESEAGAVFANAALIPNVRAFPMNQSAFISSTSDFQSINPLDAGFRIQLPGVIGTTNSYLVRVRSSNLAPTDPSNKLQDLAQVANGLSSGPYRLQIRLQQMDEVAGSTIRHADIRFATTGIEVLGLPGHSPLTSETAEDPASDANSANAQNLGNIANSDRAGISIAGTINNANDLDWYRFRITRDSIQAEGGLPLGTVLDVDYADGLGRPDTTLWVYRLVNNVPQLVLIGTDSNVADDRAAPGLGNSSSDLSRGSFGPRDPFIGAQELPDGEYLVGITPASRVESQFQQFTRANATNPLFRVEPISSVQRIVDDHFENPNFPLPNPLAAQQVAFDGNSNAVPFNLSDVTLFVSQDDESPGGANRSRLLYANAMTGAREAEGASVTIANDIAVSPAGTVVTATRRSATTAFNDNTVNLTRLEHDGTAITAINAGIDTFEAYASTATPPVFSVTQAQNPNAANTVGDGMEFTALTFAGVGNGNNTLALFGVAKRGNNAPYAQAILGGNPVAITGILPPSPTTPFKNILYRLNPDTLVAQSPTGVPNRAGNVAATGAGTSIREHGIFGVTTSVFNNTTGDLIVVTQQAAGDIVGLAQVGDVLYGVTDQRELWSMPIDLNSSTTQSTRISASLPAGLTGLTRGPRNVEGGIYANMLFATDATGRIYAFDIAGVPQAVFPGGNTSIQTAGADGLGTVNGIDFAALDVNLWHTSNTRGGDAGHGRPATFDRSRPRNQAGGTSLYFGYEPTGGNAIDGNWGGIYAASATTRTYDFAGGAAGAIESNPLDLRSYSVGDKPMLYFNYRAATQNSNGPNTDNNPMLDAFRVYGITPDGNSILLATNNATDDNNYLNANNEVEPLNTGNFDAFGTPYRAQVLFDVNEDGNADGWRQARVPLAALAGLNGVKLRFEFSTAGTFRSADPLRGGIELGVVPGFEIEDGDTFTISGPGPTGTSITRTFEFDHGLVLNLPGGASIRSGDQLTIQGQVFTFVTTATGAVNEIVFSEINTPAEIAQRVRAELVDSGYSVFVNAASPNVLNVNTGSVPLNAAGPHSADRFPTGTIVNPLPVNPQLVLAMPAGSAISAASRLVVEGQTFTFATVPTGAANEIVYLTTNTAAQITALVRTRLIAAGFTVPPPAGANLNVRSGTLQITPAGLHSVTSLPAATIVSLPQAAVLTLKMPNGSAITSGSQIVVQGQAFTFVTVATGASDEIVYSSTNTAAQIAQLLRNALLDDGFTVVIPGATPDTLQVSAGSRLVSNAGAFSVTGLAPEVIAGLPGVSGSQVSVPVHQAMTAVQVRDVIRQALASTFNPTTQSTNVNVWKFQNNTLRLHNYTVDDAGPLVQGAERPGDLFGPQDPVNGNTPSKFAQAFQRSLNNANEGIFVDDIIVGLAERGEMVVNATAATPSYLNDPHLTNGGFVDLSAPPNGAYQLEIRTAADYLLWSLDPSIDPELGRIFGPNDRLSQQVALVVNSASEFRDGDTFTLSDGINQVTFEFNIIVSAADRANGITSGNVAINLTTDATVEGIVRAIRDAINSPTVQSILKLTASADGDEPTGGGGFLNPNQSAVLQLHGQAAADLLGSLETNLAGLTLRQFGTEAFGEDLGDSNRRRDQGQIVIASNTIRNSRTVGVLVDNAVRDQSNLGPFTGDRPYPGSVRNLVTNNLNNLAPGVVIVNNIVASNSDGGILVSGDNASDAPRAASNIARILNNTVYGAVNGDTGISIEESASATILNNIVSNFTTGVSLTGASGSTVLGANVFKTNATQVVGGTTGTFPIALGPLDPLFADISSNRFYLAPFSQAIDSSLANLAELGVLSQVKNSVGLPASPALAPERDVNGVLRADDPLVTPPQGQNVAFDRGAVERSDNVKIKAILTGPLDNDSANVDVDRNATYVTLLSGSLDHFSILLTDPAGSGVDARTVVPESVVLTENGRAVTERIDYNFGFNPGSNTIRLTPLSGLWRRDSVYEITLINKPTFRLDTGDGTALVDGDAFSVTLADGTSRTLEFDSGFMIDVPFSLTGTSANGQTITYIQAGGTSRTFEFTLTGTPLNPNNTPISVVTADTFLTIAEKIETALSSVLSGGSYPVDHLGQGRVYVGGVTGDQLQASANFVNITGRPGVASTLRLQVPLTGGAGLADSQVFSIQSASGTSVTFEFDSNASSGFGTRVISFLTSDSADVIASKIAVAIAGAGLGLTPTTLPGGIVLLNESRGFTLNLLSSNLTSTGVAGGAIALPYISSSSFSANQIALQTIRALNQIGQGVKAFSVGSGSILIEGISSINGKGTSTLPTIRDVAGNVLDANRANSLTQFTIVMPDVKLDFGDAPGVGSQTLLANNGARHTLLPPDAAQIFLGSAIDFESDGQPNATATGDDSSGTPDDEDGVTINGFFNIRSPETSVVVNASGAGFVDAWIDWNRDGDFSDVGEQVLANQVVSQGNTTFGLLTPATASVGNSVMRVRLSALGNLLSGGVGIGGEVEDHQIEIIRSFAPITVDDSYSVDEDASIQVAAPGILSNDSDPDVGQLFTVFDSDSTATGIQPLRGPSFGTLILNSDGSFDYQPNSNFSGIDTFTYHAIDSFGLRSLNPATVTITVNLINDAPEFSIPTPSITVGEDGIALAGSPSPVSIANFATDIRRAPVGSVGEEGQNVSFSLLPLVPSLFATEPSIDSNGTLSFTLANDVNSNFSNFDGRIVVTLLDNGSSVSPNVNSSAPFMITINVTPINDAPIPDAFSRTVTEDSTTEFLASDVLVGDLRGPSSAIDELTQELSIASISTASAQGGVVTPTLTGNNVTSFTYTPSANFVGTDTITYTLSDNVSPAPGTAIGTINITVTAVNDAPVFSIPSVINVDEDQGSIINGTVQTQVPVTINAFATGVSPGPIGASDEALQGLTFNVVAADASFFEVLPAIVRSSTNPSEATLTFTLAKHRNNLSPNGGNNLIRVTLEDDGSDVLPNVDRSLTQTFSINIRPVNDAPVPDVFTPTVVEDSATNFTAAQVLAGDVAGPAGAEDEIASQNLTITRVDQRSSQGGVINQTGVASITGFRYIPALNFVGQDTFTYTLSDNAAGSPRTAVGTVTVTVTAINDAPEFSAGQNVVINEDAGAYSEVWATNVLPGPSNALDEIAGVSKQDVRFEVTATNQSLFKTLPLIDASGRLSFEAARNANGNAVVTLTAIDTGSGEVPNVNRSLAVSFTISVTPVNDAPTFVSGGDVTVDEDAGAVSQNWATAILAAGPLGFTPPEANDESTQSVSFVVTSNSNAALFAVPPAVGADGKLSFTTAPNANGASVITLVARDNESSTSPNTSESQPVTFTINLTAVNDAPEGVGDRYQTSEDTVLTSSAAEGVIINDSDPDNVRNEFSVVPGNITSLQGASIVMSSDGSFTYDPRSAVALQRLLGGATLDDTFTYRLQDALGAVSRPVTVTVTVQGANDAPAAVNDVLGATPNATTLLNVLANDTDPDTPIDLTSVQIGILPTNGTAFVLANGQVSYTPNLGFRGSDSFSYRVRDSLGVLSNEGTVTVRINNLPVAVPDRASVLAASSVVINVLSNDTDGDGVNTINRSSVTIVANSLNGTASVLTDGTIRFTPTAGFTGTTTFTYSIKDTENPPAESAPGVVTVDVVQSLYQNVGNRFDVNNDGFVSPIDALIIINDLQRRGSRPLPPGSFTPPPFIDVDGSGSVEPVDVLQVINYLNRQARSASGEGERTTDYAAPAVLIAAPSHANSGLISSIDVMTVTPEQVMQRVARLVTHAAQQHLHDASMGSDFDPALDEDESIVVELSSSLTPSKRSAKTDSVFAGSIDELWG